MVGEVTVKSEIVALSDDEDAQPVSVHPGPAHVLCRSSSSLSASSKPARKKTGPPQLDLPQACRRFSKLVQTLCPCSRAGKSFNCLAQFRNEADVTALGKQFLRLRSLANYDMDSEAVGADHCFI